MTSTQHHSLYINLYLIRLFFSACLPLLCCFYGRRREGRARIEGSEVDMGLLLINTTGGKVEPSQDSRDKPVFLFISRIL